MFQRFTDRNILRVLVGGFGVVIVFLALAGFVGIRSVRVIQSVERQPAGSRKAVIGRLTIVVA